MSADPAHKDTRCFYDKEHSNWLNRQQAMKINNTCYSPCTRDNANDVRSYEENIEFDFLSL